MYDNDEVNFMNNDKFLEILKNIENRSDISSEQIPSLDLYIDQIMTLFDNYLNDHKRYEDDKLLTNNMIKNYSKEGILKPIKGKKYSKEHILQMLLIYSLKKTVFRPSFLILHSCVLYLHLLQLQVHQKSLPQKQKEQLYYLCLDFSPV